MGNRPVMKQYFTYTEKETGYLKSQDEKLAQLITAAGHIYREVNPDSYDAQKYQEYWAAYDVPRHLWHFRPSVMQRFGVRHNFILEERHPMPMDAFYVSMLSEKYKGSRLPFVKGLWTGLCAWFSALNNKERSSSMIYVFRKK